MILTTLVYVVLCAVLCFGCFCRACRACRHTTRLEVRVSIVLLAAMALAAGAAPWLWGYWPGTATPDLLLIGMLAGLVLLQLVSAESWADGVPAHYRRENA